MNQFRRVGWMTMWAATVLAFVLSFDQPAATYAMALRPASDTRNYLGLPWPVPEARKWTLVVAGVAFVAVILIAGAQSLLVRRWVSPRRAASSGARLPGFPRPALACRQRAA